MMYLLKLITKNTLRHPLRTTLTLLGLVIAIFAFGFLQTVVNAWYAGANAASATTLVTRNATSLVFSLPISYGAKIRAVDGVEGVGNANWFGGIYQDPKNFFAQFAISGASYLDIYPDYLLPPEQRAAFLRDRKGCIVGRKLADQFGFKVGDVVPLRGTIFPGNWEFVVRGIYDGKQPTTNTSQFFFHWDYLNETLSKTAKRRANFTGVFVIKIKHANDAASVSNEVDAQFKNSLAETLTETEKAFQLGFVSMSEAIVAAIRVVSLVVIVIIVAVMANTMAMSARERMGEYATLKALGFGPGFLAGLILGESIFLSLVGGLIGVIGLFPAAKLFSSAVGTVFPVFEVDPETALWQMAAALGIGVLAALLPTARAVQVNIVEGLRSIA